MTTSVERVIKGKYSESDVEYLRDYVCITTIYLEIKRDLGFENNAYEILELVLERIGKKFNRCKETGKPIVYLHKKENIVKHGIIDKEMSGEFGYDRIGEPEYYCPHCGRKLNLKNDVEAMKFVRGEINEY
jgi:DNA-directed RNA polymerase subunit RPC12/RpoP